MGSPVRDTARMSVLAAVLWAMTPAVQAADCGLKKQLVLKLFETTPADLFTPAAAPVVTTSYRLGEAFDVKIGDIVLRRQIDPAGQTAVFPATVQYRASLPMTARYTLEKDQPYTLLDIPQMPGVRALVLPEVHEGLDEYLFVDAQGRLCEHALLYKRWNGQIAYRTGSFQATPDVAAAVTNGTPDTSRGNGIAIILNAIDAVGFDLSSRVTVDGKMGEAQHRSFDRQAGEIDFAGFHLKILATSDTGMTLSVTGEPEAAH